MGVSRRYLLRSLLFLSAVVALLLFLYVSSEKNAGSGGVVFVEPQALAGSLSFNGAERSEEEQKSDPLWDDLETADGSERSKGINVVMTFAKAKTNLQLKKKFQVCIASMLEHSSLETTIYLHLIGDPDSIAMAKDIVSEEATSQRLNATDIRVIPHNLADMTAATNDLIAPLKTHFIYKPGSYYSDSLFFFSMALHTVLTLDRIIVLDVDLRFLADIAELNAFFDRFDGAQLIGIASEQQPVYRHIFHAYRKSHPDTPIGGHPPDGFAGFNSAVLLLDLQKMRSSETFARLLDVSNVGSLVKKYQFHGHLGDQDYFTLIGTEHQELFHVLPCGWNRQLCQWWRGHGYQTIFDEYHRCDGNVKILHGNCNTPIPDQRPVT